MKYYKCPCCCVRMMIMMIFLLVLLLLLPLPSLVLVSSFTIGRKTFNIHRYQDQQLQTIRIDSNTKIQKNKLYTLNHNIIQKHIIVRSSSSSNTGTGTGNSASEQERYREEKRRVERKNDVIIGQTSAIIGEKDYELNVVATTEQYLLSSSALDQKIYHLTDTAIVHLKLYQLYKANTIYNTIFTLKPKAYIWQAGIVKFYLYNTNLNTKNADTTADNNNNNTSLSLSLLYGAATIFTNSIQLFEYKFNEPATEERIWRYACSLKLFTNMSKLQQKQLLLSVSKSKTTDSVAESTISSNKNYVSPIDTLVPKLYCDQDDNENTITKSAVPIERRKVMKLIHELFYSTVYNNISQMILARAKLEAIAGVIIVQNDYDTNHDIARPRQRQQKKGIITTTISTNDAAVAVATNENNNNQQSVFSNTKINIQVTSDRKLWKLNSLYYLGLHYDCIGNVYASQQCMKYSLQLCPNNNSNDIIHTLPSLHMTVRDWYNNEPIIYNNKKSTTTTTTTTTTNSNNNNNNNDNGDNVDNPYQQQPSVMNNDIVPTTTTNDNLFHLDDTIRLFNNNNNNDSNNTTNTNKNIDSTKTYRASSLYDTKLLYMSIQSSIRNLRVSDLQVSLRSLQQKATGNKEELQNRLYYTLIDQSNLYT